jgi:hypothetical protein
MSKLSRAALAIAAFFAGIPISFVLAALYVHATYNCTPGPLEPCDSGAYAGLGLGILLSPVLGTIFALATYRFLARRGRHEA